MEKIKHLSLALCKPGFVNGLFFCFLVSACSNSKDVKSSTPVPFIPADMQNIGRDNSVRSVSAGEALSRGRRRRYPTGSPLQEFYYTTRDSHT